MELYSGLPYWIAKNPLYNYFNPLESDYEADIVIIGTGITGSLAAHELCSAGFKCCMIDKRGVAQGSSTASTALLQYEIDTPLSELAERMGEESAVKAYACCLQSIADIKSVFKSIRCNPDFEDVPSVYYAASRKGLKLIKKEYSLRTKNGLPVKYLGRRELKNKYGIKAPGALENNVSAQIDTYAAAVHLIDYHLKHSYLTVFTHTEVEECSEEEGGYVLKTANGKVVKCKYVVIASGFESGRFLPKQVMKLTSTYAVVSKPLHKNQLWKDKSLIWETGEPYLYIRTTNGSRIIAGGEDEEFKDPVKRDKLLRKKVRILEKKMQKLFPDIPFETDMAWCGTFSSTSDGLPYIGCIPGRERMFYALGYGGNGITFSMIAAQMLRNKLEGRADEREHIFGFERKGSEL